MLFIYLVVEITINHLEIREGELGNKFQGKEQQSKRGEQSEDKSSSGAMTKQTGSRKVTEK